ncbi:Protein PHLOEM PROTEIN 2-LIKE A10 [Camellia lanceoleosa]|uniref:Protein PHLOEM PROTEIN 2-LIKE A10 n=1 Tax=Camellia lanceoleosa TaxID=1840588 RepID=A0ACC0IM70_9ERIC|nr:Protein PHLOEM PROTEIN 2-LIKE A10 [Camellia lanceoleosa]
MNVNPYDELFSGLTNPKHERKLKDMLGSICNVIDDFECQTTFKPASTNPKARKLFYENEDRGWVNKMSSTLAVPSNRKLVLDLTGRVTFEIIRSFLEFLLEKLWDGMRSSLNVVHEIVVGRGLEVVRYVRATSSAIVSICISLCLHMFGGVWILVPA